MPGERVFAEGWKGNKLTAPALATVERRWATSDLYPDATRLTIKDTEVTGLELRLSRQGGRSWAVSMRVHGIQRRFTLTDSSEMSLADARHAARELRVAVRNGADPTERKRQERRVAARDRRNGGATPTLKAVLDQFEQAVALPKMQKSWSSRRKHVEAEYREHLDQPVAALRAEDIRRVLDDAAKRGSPVSGWHGFRYLRRLLSWAARRGMVEVDPTAAISRDEVFDTVQREGQRDRVLSPAELRAVWTALDSLPGSPYAVIYKLILLTGQRPSEVSTMRWSDVDLDRAEWVQTDNKSSRRHVVPFSHAAVDILRSLDRSGRYAFPMGTGAPLDARTGNWDRFTKEISTASGVSGWSRHDLRRTAAMMLAEAKVDRTVIELLLNHSERVAKGGTVASIYNRHSYAMEKRQAVEKLAERVAAIVTDGVGGLLEFPVKAGVIDERRPRPSTYVALHQCFY